MKTLYARSDVESFFNKNCPHGGHTREMTNRREHVRHPDPADPNYVAPEYKDERLTITCEACEPLVMSFVQNVEDRRTGELKCLGTFSDNADVIPLTKGEELAAKKANDQMAKTLGTAQAEMFKQFQQWVASGAIIPN